MSFICLFAVLLLSTYPLFIRHGTMLIASCGWPKMICCCTAILPDLMGTQNTRPPLKQFALRSTALELAGQRKQWCRANKVEEGKISVSSHQTVHNLWPRQTDQTRDMNSSCAAARANDACRP